MPVRPTYPGVYIEEVPSEVCTIVGVATSVTAFIGRAKRGPADKAVLMQSFSEFQTKFGGLWRESTLSYAVQHYFLHGGKDAIIVRVAKSTGTASITLPAGGDSFILDAIEPGAWGNALRASVSFQATKDPATLFTLTLQELEEPGSNNVVASETFLNLSADHSNRRFVATIIDEESRLVKVSHSPQNRPDETVSNQNDLSDTANFIAANTNGSDGIAITDAEITHPNLRANRKGMYALEEVDIFNLLCIPPLEREADGDTNFGRAAKFCKDHRAVLIMDPPLTWDDIEKARNGIKNNISLIIGDSKDHTAVYFPRIRMPDSLQENRLQTFAPCGAVAGIIARTDSKRGVWKAPAGIEASFSTVRELTYKLKNDQHDQLNSLGLNCIRQFSPIGTVIWGARTLDGADILNSEWKFLPVRRLALHIEESLYRGTQWVAFEPNGEPLWSNIRLTVGAFMNNLFRQGAFQGQTPREAYFVKCNKETTTQNDIDHGVVNILVGFAPLKPAEFMIIRIQQIARKIEM